MTLTRSLIEARAGLMGPREGGTIGDAPAPDSTDHIRIESEYGLFIGNEFRPSSASRWSAAARSSGRASVSIGPATAGTSCSSSR